MLAPKVRPVWYSAVLLVNFRQHSLLIFPLAPIKISINLRQVNRLWLSLLIMALDTGLLQASILPW